jgi:hypothetical protein
MENFMKNILIGTAIFTILAGSVYANDLSYTATAVTDLGTLELELADDFAVNAVTGTATVTTFDVFGSTAVVNGFVGYEVATEDFTVGAELIAAYNVTDALQPYATVSAQQVGDLDANATELAAGVGATLYVMEYSTAFVELNRTWDADLEVLGTVASVGANYAATEALTLSVVADYDIDTEATDYTLGVAFAF